MSSGPMGVARRCSTQGFEGSPGVPTYTLHADPSTGESTAYWYYVRTLEGSEYPIYCRTPATGGPGTPPHVEGAIDGEQILLDAFDGVPASRSSVAAQLADITGQVAASKHATGQAGTAARLRVAAAVFGG